MVYLTKEEEDKIIKAFQEEKIQVKRDKYFQLIVENNIRFCVSYLHLYLSDELKSDILVAIFIACNTFDFSKNVKFSTHLQFRLKGIKHKYISQHKNTTSFDMISDTTLYHKNDVSMLEIYEEKYERALCNLDTYDLLMLQIFKECDLNYHNMGKRIKKTHQRCHQIMKDVFGRVRFQVENPSSTFSDDYF